MNAILKKRFIITGVLIISCVMYGFSQTSNTSATKNDYYVAAYIWPSCHDDPMGREILWPEGTGEWEIIQKGNPRFEGHYQPKIPLWGYELDNDPKVMEKWIDAAVDHGVNVFIFDWYWYDQGPFLESCLNDGFLKAPNNEKMYFYVMWANHDVRRNYWNVHRYKDDTSILWDAAVDWANFRIIVERVIRQYFKRPNYFKIDGCPVFSIFDPNKFIRSFGSPEEARKALDYFRDETKKAGFPGLHVQMTAGGNPNENSVKRYESLGVNSLTQYNWGGPHPEDFIQWGVEAMERIDKWGKAVTSIQYFPNASIGWDDSPRFPAKGQKDIVHYNKSPESFATFLQKAKEFCDSRAAQTGQPKLITVFSWNEWVEGGYLLPDIKYGFGYLEAVKDVMNGKYERYKK